MSFELLTFGKLRLVDCDGRQVAFPENGLLALCYLLSCGMKQASRNSIARLLWGDADVARSLVNLRKLISRVHVRQAELGQSFLHFTPQSVTLAGRDDGLQLSCDMIDFAKVDQGDALVDLRMLVVASREPFLDGIVSRNPALDAWIAGARTSQTSRLCDALIDCVSLAKSQDELSLVKEAALRVFEHDPHDERIGRILMQVMPGEVSSTDFRGVRSGEALQSFAKGSDRKGLHAVRRIFDGGRQDLPASAANLGQQWPGGGMRQPVAMLPRLALLPPSVRLAHAGASTGRMAEALIEDITVSLCALRTVAVVAPYTAAQISRDSDKAALIQRHCVTYVLDTRLSDDASGQTMFAQLIHFGSDEIVWAERYRLEFNDFVRNRLELALRIAASISSEVERHGLERDSFERNSAAYHHYLVGQNHLKHLTLPDIRRARKAFRAALRESPSFSPALSGLARTLSREWLITACGDVQLLLSAQEHANRAISSGQGMPGGYRELGVATMLLGRFDESEHALDLSETLSPHFADIIADHADTLVHASKPEEGLAKILKAIELNPIPPDIYLWTAAGASYNLQRYPLALGYISKMKDSTPAHRLAAANWAMLGEASKARAYMRKARNTHPDFDIAKWLSTVPIKEQWQRDHYREGLRRAGF